MTTTSTVYATTCSDDSSLSGSSAAWTNPTNAQGADDAVYATYSAASGAWSPVEKSMRLFLGGAYVGDEKGSTAVSIPTGPPLTRVSYGSSSDTWNASPTANQCNSLGFGYAVARSAAGVFTHYLKCTWPTFKIINTATIKGILIEVFVDSEASNSVSFAAGTVVATPQGNKRIEELNIGDAVYGFRYGKVVQGRITAKRTKPRSTIKLKAGNKWVECTSDHRFYIGRGKYKSALGLSIGEIVYKMEGGLLSPVMVQEKSLLTDLKPVYTIEVSECHNYFANGFAVHNIIIGGGGSVQVDSVRATITYTALMYNSHLDGMSTSGARETNKTG